MTLQDLFKSFDQNIQVDVAILEFSKAFDTVPHDKLLHKIDLYGIQGNTLKSAKTRSDRDFEISLCYTPKAFSCLEEIKYNINHCLELAPSFPKMYNIAMF